MCGFANCGLVMAEAERYLPNLVDKIESIVESVGLAQDAITIGMTGCPNRCAHPYIAKVAFVGGQQSETQQVV